MRETDTEHAPRDMLDLTAISLVDQHAHNLLRPEVAAALPYPAFFSEAYDPEMVARHAGKTLAFRRALREVAAVLGCEPTVEAVGAARERLGFEAMAARFFSASGIEAALLDDGLLPDRSLPLAWHARFLRVYRLVRVEFLAERLIADIPTWDGFEHAFRAALSDLPGEVVGLKSIIAYRTGLVVARPEPAEVAAAFGRLRRVAETAGARPRLADKPLNDWVVFAALEAAARRGLPVQFHTGFGDPDLDLRLANPLHLRPLFEDPAFRGVPIVLLHAAYPFAREAGYLAAVYPNAYIDFGLAVPTLSVAGMAFAVRALLELTPLSKILFASDGHGIPETFYLGALWGRRVLARELERAVQDGDLTASDAEAAAEDILRRNASRLYGLGGA